MITKKTCKRCLVTKKIEDFQHRIYGGRDFYLGTCRKCNYVSWKIARDKKMAKKRECSN